MSQAYRGGMPLYPQQTKVVDHALSNNCTVVSAGAGSGKTHTMLATVLELVEQGGLRLDRIALITFTNAAADELAERLQHELHERSQRDQYWLSQLELSSLAFIGTIHRFCHQLLTRYAYSGAPARSDAVSTRKSFLAKALDEVVESLLRDGCLLTELNMPEFELRERFRSALDLLRAAGFNPDAILANTKRQPEDSGKKYRVAFCEALAQIAAAHDAEKARAGVMDANDLLHHTAAILEGRDGVQVAEDATRRWNALLVDEFQDTDGTQKRIIDCLVQRLRVLVVVGDPKQSIYKFRGANVSLLEELAEEQMGSGPLRLPISRRPTHVLLDAQNGLFSGIADRYPELQDETAKDEQASQPSSPLAPFVYLRVPRAEEVRAIAGHIRLLSTLELPGEKRPLNGGDMAVLVRSNAQVGEYVAALSAELRSDGISVVAEAGESFYTRPAIVATFRVLAALLDYPDDALLSAALATPYFVGVDPTQREILSLQYGVKEGSPLTDWFESEHPDLQTDLKTMRDAVRTDTAPQFLSRLYDVLPIKEYFRGAGDPGAIDDLERLREEARRLFRNEEALTVRIFVDWLRLQIQQNSPITADDMYSPATTSVRVMTIHRAKGREFPVVVLPAMFRGLYFEGKEPWYVIDQQGGLDLSLPTRSQEVTHTAQWPRELADHRQAELREEMRLLYVAVTRAVHQVVFAGDPQRMNGPNSSYYCWADEVLRVYSRIPGALTKP